MKSVTGVALPVERTVFDFLRGLESSVLLVDLECEYSVPLPNVRVLQVHPDELYAVLGREGIPEEVVVLNRVHTFATPREMQRRLNALWSLAYRNKTVYFTAEFLYAHQTFSLKNRDVLERSCQVEKFSLKAEGFLF
ncbi:hypothetical protein NECID01_0838 [Nematocida sp. AWRm77]|nr:hypothetical protein NECID01_0838 [Nematocida sp. AWRm77]